MPRLYTDLASWWPLVSDPAEYAEEAEAFAALLPRATTVLELGSGGGNLASHLKRRFRPTLSDVSPRMLEVSRALNPELEHVQGDMRALRLGREFDAVLIHDAIMYCTSEADVRAALATASAHLRADGALVIAPDCVRESFEPETSSGGRDGADGRAVRYLEWSFDPDPDDTCFETVYALVLREADGTLRSELDRHVEGLFSQREWLAWLSDAGFDARMVVDAWERRVFAAQKR